MKYTREERNAYSRGYQHGVARRWPEHQPPTPPHAIVGELVAALRNLRDEIDTTLACFTEDDEINLKLSPHIDRADQSLCNITEWLKNPTCVTPCLTDGFGNYWHKCQRGEDCEMQIVRPGKAQCGRCEKT